MANTSMLYILNEKQRVIGVASNESPEALPYFNDSLTESIETGVVTYEFSVPAQHPTSEKLIANNHIVVRDLDGNFLLFTIKEVIEAYNDGVLIKSLFCENTAVSELLGEIIAPQTLSSLTLSQAIQKIMKDVSEWSVLDIPYTESKDVNISEHTNLLEVLSDLMKLYEVEMYFTIELTNMLITKKIIHFTKKRGQDTNLRFEYGLNLTDVTRKEDSTGVISALYGVGKGDGENLLTLAGFGLTDDGDFYHLSGSEWIGSHEAVKRWGRNGKHIFDVYKSDTADTAEQLFQETLTELKRRVNPLLTYEAKIVDLERITNIDGQKLRVGDRVLIIDKTFNPAIILSARVIELKRSLTNPMDDAAKLGEYRPLKPSLSKLIKGIQSDANQSVKYPELPKIKQDFTDEVIKPIVTVVDEVEEKVGILDDDMKDTVQKVVDIDAALADVSSGVDDIKEVIKDVKIYKQPEAPTDVPVDTLWIDTDEKPISFMRRWDGTTWQKLAPASPSDIGAVSSSDYNTKMSEIKNTTDGLSTKYETVSTKINGGVGGRNIVPNSNAVKDTTGWKVWSSATKIIYPLSVNAGFVGGGLVFRESDLTVNSTIGVRSPAFSVKKNKVYTISFVVGASNYTLNLDYCYLLFNKSGVGNQSFTVGDVTKFPFFDNTRSPDNALYNTYKVSVTLTANADSDSAEILIGFRSTGIDKEEGVWVRYLKVEEGTFATSWTPANEDTDAAINDKVSSVTYTQKIAEIETTANGISQRVGTVEQTTTDQGTRLKTAEATIKTQANQISSKVESSTYTLDMKDLTGRVSIAETWINQTDEDITFLVKKDEVGSYLNQSPDGFKILGKYLDISGLVTFTTFDQSTQDKINGIDTKAGNAQTTATAAQTTANTAKTNAATAQNAINDMANDNKLTAMEKHQVKKEWDVMAAEKPTIEATAVTYGITTEKTNFVNSYNALNTYLTPLLSSLSTTSDIVGTTFRANFDDYYDKKALLMKKIDETAKTLANNAQSTATTANGTANGVKGLTDGWTMNTTQINGGKIATGTVTSLQINVNELFANSAVVGKITAYDINADKIKSGVIKGIKYESINASNPQIKLVLEGNTLKSYGAIDATTKIQDYSEFREGSLYMYRYTSGQTPIGAEIRSEITPEKFRVWNKLFNAELWSGGLSFSVNSGQNTGSLLFDQFGTESKAGIRAAADAGFVVQRTDGGNDAWLRFDDRNSIQFDRWGNIKAPNGIALGAIWHVNDSWGRERLSIPVEGSTSGDYVLKNYGGRFKFNIDDWTSIEMYDDKTNVGLTYGQNALLKWQRSVGRFEFRNSGDSGWVNAAAGSFQNASSFKWKTDIQNYEGNATEIISNSDVMSYKMKPVDENDDVSTLPTHIGLIAEYAPNEIRSEDGSAVDLYAMISLAWKSIQELNVQINEIKAENVLLKERLDGLTN